MEGSSRRILTITSEYGVAIVISKVRSVKKCLLSNMHVVWKRARMFSSSNFMFKNAQYCMVMWLPKLQTHNDCLAKPMAYNRVHCRFNRLIKCLRVHHCKQGVEAAKLILALWRIDIPLQNGYRRSKENLWMLAKEQICCCKKDDWRNVLWNVFRLVHVPMNAQCWYTQCDNSYLGVEVKFLSLLVNKP